MLLFSTLKVWWESTFTLTFTTSTFLFFLCENIFDCKSFEAVYLKEKNFKVVFIDASFLPLFVAQASQ